MLLFYRIEKTLVFCSRPKVAGVRFPAVNPLKKGTDREMLRSRHFVMIKLEKNIFYTLLLVLWIPFYRISIDLFIAPKKILEICLFFRALRCFNPLNIFLKNCRFISIWRIKYSTIYHLYCTQYNADANSWVNIVRMTICIIPTTMQMIAPIQHFILRLRISILIVSGNTFLCLRGHSTYFRIFHILQDSFMNCQSLKMCKNVFNLNSSKLNDFYFEALKIKQSCSIITNLNCHDLWNRINFNWKLEDRCKIISEFL